MRVAAKANCPRSNSPSPQGALKGGRKVADVSTSPSPRAVPLLLSVALFMEQMDSTVIATALPAIAANIGASPVALKLALTAYLVALAIFIPLSAFVADRFGAKRVFRLAIGVFVAGSLACAFAGSLGGFVAARFLQGAGAAMMTPVGRVILVRALPRGELVRAWATLTIPVLIGPLAGPPVGGFLTTFFSWHWIFLINLPIGALGAALATRILPDMPGGKRPTPDLTGFSLTAIAAAGLVFGLSVVSLPALPPAFGAASIAAGLVAAFAYVRHARRTPTPILDLSLFSRPSLRAAIAGGFLFRIGVGATPFLLPLLFQLVFGMTPFASGLITFVTAAGAIAMKFLVEPVLARLGFRLVLTGAALISGCLIGGMAAFSPGWPVGAMMAMLFFAGFFRSLFFTAVNPLTFAETSDAEAAQATALSAVFQQLSLACGVALAGGILEASTAMTGALGPTAFSLAFAVTGLIAAGAAAFYWRLDPAAGANLSARPQPASPS